MSSNIFKSNENRFNFLSDSDNTKEKPFKKKEKKDEKENNFKGNYFKNNNNNDTDENFKIVENKKKNKQTNNEKISVQKEKEEIKLEKEEQINQFPELISSVKLKSTNLEIKNNANNANNFKDLFLSRESSNSDNEEKEKEKEEKIPDGYICVSYNKQTRKIQYKKGKMNDQNNINKNRNNYVNETMNKICNVYEKRKKEYVEMWGEEEYEKNFKFPCYDYEYFNKLDYEYEQQFEHMDDSLSESEEQMSDYIDYNR